MAEDLDAEASAFLDSLNAGSGASKSKKAKKKKKGKAKPNTSDGAAAVDTPDQDANTTEPAVNGEAGEPVDEAARIMAEMGLGDTEPSGNSNNKKKKKKGKKKDTKKAPVVSAAGRLAAQRLAQQKEDEERRKREEEEERKRIEAEEARIAEEERKIQEKKDRLKEKKKKKKAEARAAGKAMTKAQKAKAAKQKAMRDQLIASGHLKVGEDGKVLPPPKKKVTYGKKKKQTKTAEAATKTIEPAEPAVPKPEDMTPSEAADKTPEQVDEVKIAAATEPVVSEPKSVVEEEDVADDWDAMSDDWEVSGLTLKNDFDEEEVVKDEVFVNKSSVNPKSKGPAPSKKKKGKKEEEKKETAADRMRKQREAEAERKEQARMKREERKREALKKRSKDDLRSPICCVMGHVDTGKTKLLDKIRRTNVQEGEAGGITQQIGATYFPMENLRKATDKLNSDLNLEYKVPGLLVIDTPGHESFSNLRKRGSNLCDIAVLVIDIMHGLEQQTLESINLLKSKRTPFIVALNKIDRLYGWKSFPGSPFRESLAKQDSNVIAEFENRSKQVITQLMEQSLNASLYYENDDYRRVVSLVPTSAHTGEGIPDLLLLLVQLTQQMMVERLMFSEELEATVIEVKKIEGIGTTIDIVLVNGVIHEGETIVVAGMNGPIETQVRALLTPQPLKEMRVKGDYVHHKSLKAAMGVKIAGQNLEDAIAGTQLMVCREGDDIEELKETVMEDFEEVMGNVSVTGHGVCVQASTLGSLEALMEFLRESKIPVAAVQLGPVHKKDVMRASIMLEHKKEYATILAFDVKITRDALAMAEEVGVKIFSAEIIYHLFDKFTAYLEEIKEQRKEEAANLAVFPSICRIISENVFMKKNPLVFGVDVIEGILKVGTPIVIPDKMVPDPDDPNRMIMLELGKVVSIQKDHKEIPIAKAGSAVAVKIQGNASQSYIQYGRHFDHNNTLYSKLSRESIDSLKENFKEDLEKQDWMTVIKLKKVFGIV
mmetsp:Transcript_4966/g.6599  ORF Transcript_4966/g.6599 Transcript_4966/m.6599 type:complete len:996 (-) Transcript_4966:649-3636(-)